MTNDRSDKVRALILSALMVLSIMVGGVAFSGSAAAAVDNISNTSADDVLTDQSEVTQNVTFDVTIPDTGGTETVNIDLVDGTSPDIDSTDNVSLVAGDTGDVSVDSVADNDGDIDIVLTDDASDGAHTVTVEVEITHDTSGISSESTETYTITDGAGTSGSPDATVDFNLIQPDRTAPGTGAGDVYDGAIVFQGEEGIRFVDSTGTEVDSLTGVSGDAEGQVLTAPISTEQTTGRYSENGTDQLAGQLDVTVDTARVTDFEVQNQNGEDIAGGSIGQDDANLAVGADYNFENAEPLEINVDEESGLSITDDVVGGSQAKNPLTNPDSPDRVSGFDVGYTVDLTEQDAGTYTITVEGDDDLDFGQAESSTTVEVRSDDNIGIELDSDTVTQGDNVRFDVTGSIAGNYHLVQIDQSEFRSGVTDENKAKIFRNVGDVEERGVIVGSTHFEPDEVDSISGEIDAAYAIVEIDDDTGFGVGSIETRFLDTISVTVDVSDDLQTTPDAGNVLTEAPNGDLVNLNDNDNDNGGEEVPTVNGDVDADDSDFDVEEGDVTLESPGNTYVAGSDVDINGTAPTGFTDVAIYVRDEGNFELVSIDGSPTVSVDADGAFEEEAIQLSDDGDLFGSGVYGDVEDQKGNDILSLPGSYRIGVIDAEDADTDIEDEEFNTVEVDDDNELPDEELSTQEFNTGTSSQQSLRVIGTSLDAEFPSLVRGQIASEDRTVTVNGSAPGSQDVLFIAVGSRGNAFVSSPIDVEDDQTFEEEDIQLTGISEGQVSLHVYSLGRDGQVGDGELPGDADANEITGLTDFIDNRSTGDTQLTGDQLRSSILSETVEDSASDDQLVNQNARITDAQSNVQNVYQSGNQATGLNPVAAGETLVVEGQTNLQSDDNTITVELANEDTTVGLASTEEWGQDGQFTLEIDTTDAATGTYTLEIDDGQNSVTEEVELVEQVSTPTATPTEAQTPTATATPTPTATAALTATAAPATETESPEPTEGDGPGFGAVVALVALLAAALLATRREN